MANAPNWKSLRFLVVDDEPMIRSIVVKLLQNLGSTNIDEARSAAEALPYLMGEKTAPDCAILDIAMTPVNGIELAFMIRSDPRIIRHDIPVVMLTGHADQSLVSAAKALDVNGFILKPASRAMMASRIDQALRAPRRIGPRESYAQKLASLKPS